MSEKQYPRMLYRPGTMMQKLGVGIDHFTAQSPDEEKTAIKQGWSAMDVAISRAKRKQKLLRIRQFYLTNWQWFFGTAVTIIIAAVFGD